MKVLVACECSGIVANAFRERGHEAYSCDISPCERDEWQKYHIKDDAIKHIDDGWDLLIAHPPCQYISKAGARLMYPTAGNICRDRLKKALAAVGFFMRFLNADVPRVAVENPTPLKIAGLPPPDCVVQPYEHGHPYSKRTLFWLRNLPAITPTELIEDYTPWIPSNTGGAKRGQRHCLGTARNSGDGSRARTFSGIANAMAMQWGGVCDE